jgi:hypothetical protein
MSFLAEVLAATPNGVIPAQHSKMINIHDLKIILIVFLGALLLEFVVSRIEDREVGIGSGAKALLALEERGKWTPETASRVLMSYVHPRVQLSPELTID